MTLAFMALHNTLSRVHLSNVCLFTFRPSAFSDNHLYKNLRLLLFLLILFAFSIFGVAQMVLGQLRIGHLRLGQLHT